MNNNAGRKPEFYDLVLKKITAIEDEMKRLGYWQEKPLPPEAFNFTQAFGADTMAYTQWIQFILAPRVHEIIGQKGEFPAGSQVGVKAVREFDGNPNASELVSLLNEFDDLFDR